MSNNARTSKLQQEIDANLKRAYEETLNEDVPDRFTDLLARLKAADQDGSPVQEHADER
ncbi:NepR family anti-sigma factor [Pseudoponticoccus marisrubri]|uniref:NepR family anti-sigma factor n=1 Tax=Pseudoponticoccus marisrubri TaxID=1685382 RepID=UPI0014701664|nr:NepR family anti-sigma factor [Pseudoponticoccus marisrubri]